MRRLLIVDDDPMILEVIEMSLELAGWAVVSASDGHDALLKASAERPDAILMDVMMPGMDGPSASVQLSESADTAHIPVILLTAKAQQSERRQWAALPVAGVLVKPFDPMRLADDIKRLLGWD